MSRIQARCRACRFQFLLAELVRASFLEGHCPSCGRPLADDTERMRRAAARCVRAHDELVEAVRTLVELPGNLELIPHSLFDELLEDVDWGDEIADDRWLVEMEVEALARYLRAWTQLAGDDGDGRRAEARDLLRRLARVLRRRASRLGPAPEGADQREGLEAAATRADEAAESVAEGRPAEDEITAALDSARQSVADAPG